MQTECRLWMKKAYIPRRADPAAKNAGNLGDVSSSICLKAGPIALIGAGLTAPTIRQ
jgi:hypothetical protein